MSKKNKHKNLPKETIEEFLARGGKVKKLDYVPPKEKQTTINQTTKKSATLLSLGEGALYYAEKRKRKKKPMKLEGIDLDCLPETVRKKLGV